jgi:hypothetical protein
MVNYAHCLLAQSVHVEDQYTYIGNQFWCPIQCSLFQCCRVANSVEPPQIDFDFVGNSFVQDH